MDTGSRLKLVRESYKMSQRELARRSGVTNATISLIEQNRVSPSVSSLKKLLEGIPMSLADFFTFDQPPREHQYVFRANEQPDLGRDGLRLLLIGASVPGRRCGYCASNTRRAQALEKSRSCTPKVKNAGWLPAAR